MPQHQLDLPARYNASEVLYHNLDAGRGARTAILCGDEVVSYDQLTGTASRVGSALRDLGIALGARVLMLMQDTPRFPAVFFGAMRAGFVPIPVNTVLPPDSYAYFLRDSAAPAVVVSAPLLPAIDEIRDDCPDLRHVIVDGEDLDARLAAASPELSPAPTTPTDPAFWLYSSGSTGFPKGVVHQHKDIPYTTETYAAQLLGIRADDICFSASKAFHAYGLGNSLTFPFSVGASAVLLTGRPSPDRVFAALERYRPTLFFTAPTLYTMLLAHRDAHGSPPLDSVRLCVSAAEALQPHVYRRWKEAFGVDILDGIGSTEMLHIFLSNRAGAVVPGSSGAPVPGYDARLEDFDGQPVPDGEPGNLLVRGGSAAVEYWNQPEKTAHTMRGDWVFTGDRYRRDADGNYFYEGRSDDMFKVSGQWVSPIEVENTLVEHPAVLECAVVLGKDDTGLHRTKACIVLEAASAPTEALTAELQAFVKSRIAPYKYPRLVEYRDDLPKTATGKIQRYKLR